MRSPLASRVVDTLSCGLSRRERTLSNLTKRSFSLAGHRTSVALEVEFWDVLTEAARLRGISLAALVAYADAERNTTTPLSSTLRVFALRAASLRSGGRESCGKSAEG